MEETLAEYIRNNESGKTIEAKFDVNAVHRRRLFHRAGPGQVPQPKKKPDGQGGLMDVFQETRGCYVAQIPGADGKARQVVIPPRDFAAAYRKKDGAPIEISGNQIAEDERSLELAEEQARDDVDPPGDFVE